MNGKEQEKIGRTPIGKVPFHQIKPWGFCLLLAPLWSAPACQVYSSLLFGLPLAVTSFNRYSKLVGDMGRRFLRTLVSIYFDDAHITDWKSSGASSQSAFTEMNAIFGSQRTFLGLDFDFSTVQTTGCITLLGTREATHEDPAAHSKST